MTTSLEWLALIATEIDSSVSLEKKNAFIAVAQGEVLSSYFSDSNTYNMAVAYLAAHYIALSERDPNPRGVLTSEKEGDLARSYSGSFNSEINTTQYLDSYNRLISSKNPNFYMQSGS